MANSTRPPPQETNFDLEEQDALVRSRLSIDTFVEHQEKGTLTCPIIPLINCFRIVWRVPYPYSLRQFDCNDTMRPGGRHFLWYYVQGGHFGRSHVQRCVQNAAFLVSVFFKKWRFSMSTYFKLYCHDKNNWKPVIFSIKLQGGRRKNDVCDNWGVHGGSRTDDFDSREPSHWRYQT